MGARRRRNQGGYEGMSEGENEIGGRVAGVLGGGPGGSPGSAIEPDVGSAAQHAKTGDRQQLGDDEDLLGEQLLEEQLDPRLLEQQSRGQRSPCQPSRGHEGAISGQPPSGDRAHIEQAMVEEHWLADGVLDAASDRAPAPSVVIVDADAAVRATLLEHLAPACAAHEVEPAGAVALLQGLSYVDIALVDCDPPPSQQAPIFRALSRWPGAVCVLMSQNHQKVEQLRALGMFAPLVLDKPLQPEALAAIRAAVLEIAEGGVA